MFIKPNVDIIAQLAALPDDQFMQVRVYTYMGVCVYMCVYECVCVEDLNNCFDMFIKSIVDIIAQLAALPDDQFVQVRVSVCVCVYIYMNVYECIRVPTSYSQSHPTISHLP